MAKQLKYIDALDENGEGILILALYDRCSPRDTPKQRAAKHKASSAAQRRMNQISSQQQLELRLAMNFPTPGSGLVVTLTHDDDHMPGSRKEAQLRFKYFLKKLRAARKAAGLPEPVAFWAPEILTSASGRWHQHIVIDNTGHDYEMIRRCWIYGSEIEIEKLRVDDEKNHETLARYMTKELRECQEYETRPGLHGWSCTRNAQKPTVETVTVPDDYEIPTPEGCVVLIDETRRTEWSSWRVVKVRISGAVRRLLPRARRRRRRR